MDKTARLYAAGIGTGAIFLAIQIGALALVTPFRNAGYQAVENPTDPTNSLVYLLAILVATAVMLVVIKLGIDQLLRILLIGVSAFLTFYVFSVVVPPLISISGIHLLAWLLAASLGVLLYWYPEWFVIDAAGILIAGGAAGLFGISFGPLPALLLLSVLAVYDAISVYRTEHMLTLAESVTDLKLPLLFVIPLSPAYSFLDDSGLPETTSSPEATPNGGATDEPETGESGFDREAFFIGLGDTVMPTIMVASAAAFVTGPQYSLPGIVVNLPAIGAMVGTFVGLGILLYFVAQGRAHAGLPLLNGGAISGYLLGALISGIPLIQALGLTPYL